MSDNDLSFVSTDDLISEIQRRCDASLIVLDLARTPDDTESITAWDGPLNWCIGLAERSRCRLVNQKKVEA